MARRRVAQRVAAATVIEALQRGLLGRAAAAQARSRVESEFAAMLEEVVSGRRAANGSSSRGTITFEQMEATRSAATNGWGSGLSPQQRTWRVRELANKTSEQREQMWQMMLANMTMEECKQMTQAMATMPNERCEKMKELMLVGITPEQLHQFAGRVKYMHHTTVMVVAMVAQSSPLPSMVLEPGSAVPSVVAAHTVEETKEGAGGGGRSTQALADEAWVEAVGVGAQVEVQPGYNEDWVCAHVLGVSSTNTEMQVRLTSNGAEVWIEKDSDSVRRCGSAASMAWDSEDPMDDEGEKTSSSASPTTPTQLNNDRESVGDNSRFWCDNCDCYHGGDEDEDEDEDEEEETEEETEDEEEEEEEDDNNEDDDEESDNISVEENACSICRGVGNPGGSSCHHCGGSGWEPKEAAVEAVAASGRIASLSLSSALPSVVSPAPSNKNLSTLFNRLHPVSLRRSTATLTVQRVAAAWGQRRAAAATSVQALARSFASRDMRRKCAVLPLVRTISFLLCVLYVSLRFLGTRLYVPSDGGNTASISHILDIRSNTCACITFPLLPIPASLSLSLSFLFRCKILRSDGWHPATKLRSASRTGSTPTTCTGCGDKCSARCGEVCGKFLKTTRTNA
jgi:hypothetical protein